MFSGRNSKFWISSSRPTDADTRMSEHQVSVSPDSGHQISVSPDSGHQVSVSPDSGHQVSVSPDSGHQVSVSPDSGQGRYRRCPGAGSGQ